jgi:hypothetical protein
MKRCIPMRVTCVGLAMWIAALMCGAQTFYVAPDGNDGWSGTRASANGRKTDGPFATLPLALKAAREWKQQNGTESKLKPATVLLRGGIYSLPEPVILTPEDSGLIISAYRNEKPILSGGRPIRGWKPTTVDGRSLWVADVPEAQNGKWYFRELWVNGTRAVRARYPNKGYLKIAEVPDKSQDWTKGQQRFRFAAGDLKAWKTLKDAEVIVMCRWVESHLPIKDVDEKERVITFGKRAVFELGPGDPYYVEGAFEALDEPGEWYLDGGNGKAYYMPRPGETPGKVEAVAPVLSQVLRCEGKPREKSWIEGVQFKGLSFSHTEWYFPSGFASGKNAPEIEPAPKPEIGGFGQAAVGVPAAVWGEGTRNCTFERCRFVDLGDYGLELAGGCVSNRITHCEFGDLGAGGIKLGETRVRSEAAEQSGANEVTDCSIHDGGKMFHSAIGIWIGQSPNNRLEHNLIHDFYYTGISIGWTWGYGPALATNNYVAFNHVHHIGVKSDGDGPILSDMGGIYTLGMQPGTRVFNNLWHDIAGIQYGGWGIYFDEGSSSIIARSNIVYHTTHGGFHQHYGATNRVENNIFAFARDHQLQRTRPESHPSFLFATNIVYFDHGVLLGGNWSGDKFEMDWNDYWDTRAPRGELKFGNDTPEQWRARGHDQHSIIADPLFVAPDKNDFTIRKNSPALKLGFEPIDLSQVGPRK